MESVEDKVEVIAQASGAYRCVECGRCVAVCPMAEMYPNFSIEMSPRGFIKKVLMTKNILEDEHLWYCTECNAGTDVCPEEVSCRDLVKGLRGLAIATGAAKEARACRSCGELYVPTPVMDYVNERLGGASLRYLDLCPSCRRRRYLLRNT